MYSWSPGARLVGEWGGRHDARRGDEFIRRVRPFALSVDPDNGQYCDSRARFAWMGSTPWFVDELLDPIKNAVNVTELRYEHSQ